MLKKAQKVFIVGIKGVAMANLAIILKKMGKNVSGCDEATEYITDSELKVNYIRFFIGFDPKNLPVDTDLVIYSAAHAGPDNPIVIEAKKRGVQVNHQAEVLAELIKNFKTSIAVCGCHGKTTTSSFLAYALEKMKQKPSYMIGSSSFNEYFGGNFQKGEYFVVEADEYGVNPPKDKTPKFHFLQPDYILCTNIDFDHPDVYKNINEVKKAFLQFFKQGKKLILCADDKNLMELAQKIKREKYLTYGYKEDADLIITDYKILQNGAEFKLTINKNSNVKCQMSNQFQISNLKFKISLFGEKNVSNTAGVILTLLTLGFPPDKIKEAIKNFTGPKRRFEKIYETDKFSLYDDYGHHPNEIKATIEAARERFPNKKLIIIFQPHTYSRTQALLSDFAVSLALADYSFVLPIFASAREKITDFQVSSNSIEREARKIK